MVEDEETEELEVEGEGDMYLEETCLDLGLLGLIPLLSFSEGNNGGLLGLIWDPSCEQALGFRGFCGGCVVEDASETATTIIENTNAHT